MKPHDPDGSSESERGYILGKVQAGAIMLSELADMMHSDAECWRAVSSDEPIRAAENAKIASRLADYEWTRAALLSWAGDLGLDVNGKLVAQDIVKLIRREVGED